MRHALRVSSHPQGLLDRPCPSHLRYGWAKDRRSEGGRIRLPGPELSDVPSALVRRDPVRPESRNDLEAHGEVRRLGRLNADTRKVSQPESGRASRERAEPPPEASGRRPPAPCNLAADHDLQG